ncbi:uncharacterized protein LOC127122615 [Lathyrus oleraceus]|uniref:uncharacterized protein LOC127122615 n=1 Tax=Pisum sativum TaxID=3888 RepID=UPI0021D0899B|nr:uncharacterized protein LOC127122615 [Pisum sativum]
MAIIEYAAKFKELGNKARSAHYKSLCEKKGKNPYRGKSYNAPADKGKHMVSYEKNTSGGGTLASIKCFKCGVASHHANDCKSSKKTGHLIVDCKSNSLTRFNCREIGHIITHFQKPKKVQFGGKYFVDCCINTGATQSFISLDCDERLGLRLFSMAGSMIIDTPTNGLVTTSWVCLNCLVTIYEFDAIDELFVSPKKEDNFMKDDDEVFMVLASMKEKAKL